MQIGFPTDVKHVAHIGSDGPNSGDASWALQDGTKESSIDDEDQDSTKPRHSRRHKSVETLTIDDSEPTNSGVKKGRRGRKKDQSIDQDKDVPAVPKQSRRRSKDDGGSEDNSICKMHENFFQPKQKDVLKNVLQQEQPSLLPSKRVRAKCSFVLAAAKAMGGDLRVHLKMRRY
ncbi:hypothetical protein ZIOFF_058240 [Zingiber officinale]|uniref:CRIB domain-containing protein n=1 Tax=Zingiber officinale TaxID=94328 RepID=A0A8J5KD08_ZINOF|nr:hypothetical protein ZIOFF_058240 [Zingiber officinale]